jgi:hypothetical protein
MALPPSSKGPQPERPSPMMQFEKVYTLRDIKSWLLRKLSFGRIKR